MRAHVRPLPFTTKRSPTVEVTQPGRPRQHPPGRQSLAGGPSPGHPRVVGAAGPRPGPRTTGGLSWPHPGVGRTAECRPAGPGRITATENDNYRFEGQERHLARPSNAPEPALGKALTRGPTGLQGHQRTWRTVTRSTNEVALVSALIAHDGGSPVAVGGGDWHGRWERRDRGGPDADSGRGCRVAERQPASGVPPGVEEGHPPYPAGRLHPVRAGRAGSVGP